MCFYLCNPETGVVIEKGHPLQNRSVTGSILALQSGKGSSVVQVDGFYQLWKKGTLPSVIILYEAEPVIVSILEEKLTIGTSAERILRGP